MAENSKIQWCDHTASPWHGCSKVSAGCDNCYAAAMSGRNPGVLGVWGDDGVRVKSKSFVSNLRLWNKQAAKDGRNVTVFPSLCDPFEDRPELIPWREEMFSVIDECPNVTLLLLTKRPENIRRMTPDYSFNACATGDCPHQRQSECSQILDRENVWLLTSVENQEQANKRIPELLKCRDLSPVLGLSCEPLLGHVDIGKSITICPNCNRHPNAVGLRNDVSQPFSYFCIRPSCGNQGPLMGALDWVIVGGESGPNARPMQIDWARSLRGQCYEAGVPFFMKQLGGIKDKRGELDQLPWDLRIREFPEVHHAT